jgi:hypothetical protein
MTDPFDALTSFQQALANGEIDLQAGELDPDLFVYVDVGEHASARNC